jgi:hypothetical protein
MASEHSYANEAISAGDGHDRLLGDCFAEDGSP